MSEGASQAGGALAWAGHTTAHPIGLALLAVCIFFVLYLPRQRAMLPFLVLLVAIPSAQRIVLGSVDFNFARILILIALARLLIRNEYKDFKYAKTDTLVIIWMIWGILSYGFLLEKMSASITRTGYMIDAVGAYFLGRVYFHTREQVQKAVLFLGLISIPMAVIFLTERMTGRNLFSELGGVPEFTVVRDGRLRCQGPFLHPIMAGVFWAGLLPWIAAMWYGRQAARFRLMIYAICISIIVVNTASSTPAMSVLFALLGVAFYPLRRFTPLLKWGTVISVPFLHLIMNAPVWHLLARINVFSGSTGYHRYNLIDKAIENIGEWWLVGTISTAHWGWGLRDVTNQYILEGVRGGLFGMVLFMLILLSVFSRLGIALRRETGLAEQWFYWMSGIMLFAHAMNFIAVSYFGQMVPAFFLLLGILVSVTPSSKAQHERNKAIKNGTEEPSYASK